MKFNGKKILPLLLASILFFGAVTFSRAVTCDLDTIKSCGTDAKCLSDVKDQCGQDVSRVHGQANTLANQISQFNYQINLTTLQIAETEQKIATLGGRIGQLEDSLTQLTTAFSSRAVETYKLSRFENNFMYILTASDISDAVSRFHYLQKIQEADRNLLEKLQVAQTSYKGQKTDQETLQKQLQQQQANLNAQKQAKANLLAITQNDEAKYRDLLSTAQAQLAALSQYAESVGISLLPHQDLSDGWGKYFNQRDSQWGNLLANGDTTNCRGGPCILARIGCLITAYAMVSTHFGGSLLPSDVASNPANFSGTSADFLYPGPSVNGHGGARIDNPTTQQLADILNSNQNATIIAGLSMNGGPYPNHYSDHWVVLRSVDGDSFRINDPLYGGAMNISLKDHYSGWTIIQAISYN